jgi:hypothetical protein
MVSLSPPNVHPTEHSFARIQLSSLTPKTFFEIPLLPKNIQYALLIINKKAKSSTQTSFLPKGQHYVSQNIIPPEEENFFPASLPLHWFPCLAH